MAVQIPSGFVLIQPDKPRCFDDSFPSIKEIRQDFLIHFPFPISHFPFFPPFPFELVMDIPPAMCYHIKSSPSELPDGRKHTLRMGDDRMTDQAFEARIQALAGEIIEDYGGGRVIDRLEMFTQPDRQIIEELIGKLFRLVFPGFFQDYAYRVYDLRNNLSALIEDVAYHLRGQIGIALKGGEPGDGGGRNAEDITAEFLSKLPEIRAYVETDLQAFYDGDPAASSKPEVIIAYPGLYAITVNRLAHVLYQLDVPLIPRIMTEYAHSRTGIDIHPGAQIGRYFFIDHGTGIVVGETTVIGDNGKLYQGVTLGALSTRGGQKLHGRRRHPTIEDNVTIYAGASILGGDTIIGHDSVIGSNVFITHPIAPGTRVSIKSQELLYKNGQGYVVQPDVPNDEPEWFYVI